MRPESGAEKSKIYPKKFKGPGIWVRFCARNPGAKSRPESGAEGLCFLNSRAPFSGAKCLRPPQIFRHYFSNLTRVSASMIMLSLSTLRNATFVPKISPPGGLKMKPVFRRRSSRIAPIAHLQRHAYFFGATQKSRQRHVIRARNIPSKPRKSRVTECMKFRIHRVS